ncbi:MAG: hypothetical protein AABZ65_06480, partial [Candidatus Omnitrophota bacterium]
NTTRGSPSSHTLTIADDDPIPDTTAPTVSISSPTSETTYSTTSSTLSLSGSASDDTTLYSVTWSSDKGGSGTATLTEKTWTISNISLTQGDNLITVTASDSSANSSSDSLTVTYTPITAPTVTTLAASSITQDSVALNGSVNPNSGSTTVWFGYGTASGSYPNTTPTQALSGSTSQEVSASLSSLSSNTTYYYRLASQNSAGTSYGTEISFTTSAAGDTTAPTVTITTPKPDSNKKYSLTYAPFINIHRVNNDTIDISGKASDNVNITSMSWYDDQGNIGPIITSDNYLHWLAKTVPINSGSHSLTIEAKDNSGNVGKDTLAINYEKAPVSQTWQHVPIRTAAQKTAGLLGGESFQWVFGMSYAPANPYVIYFINDVSKVWKSSDGGNTWHPKGGNGFRAHAGNSLAVDPKDENIVFVTGSVQGGQDISGPYDGIYRTKDGGENWELVKQVTYLRTNSRNGTEIVFSGNNIYAGTTKDGLFKSTDGGDAWSSLNLFVGQKVLDLKSHPAQEGVLFVSIDDPSGTTNDGLYKVTESAGAASAAKIGFGLQTYPNEIAISNNDPLRVYAAVRKYGVYKSTDGGENFVPANTGMDAALTAGREAKQIGISPVIGGDDYLWVSYSYGFIYYSHNNGANWKEPVSYDEKNSDGWVDGSIKGGISAGKGPFSSSPFAPHPFDKNIVMAIGASNAPKKSEDGGVNFRYSGQGYAAANPGRQSPSWLPNDPNKVAVFTIDYGPYLSEDNFSTFKSLDVPVFDEVDKQESARAGAMALDGSGVIITAVGTWTQHIIIRSADNGKTWTRPNATDADGNAVSTIDSYDFIAFDPRDNNIVYADWFKSADKGLTWKKLSKVVIGMSKDGAVIYAADDIGSYQNIYKSSDGGEAWAYHSKLNVSTLCELAVAVDKNSNERLYVAGSTAGIHVWDFDAKSWSKKTETDGFLKDYLGSYETWAIAVDHNKPNIIYAGRRNRLVDPNEGVYRSLDYGNTWEDISYNLGGDSISIQSVKVSPHDSYVYIGSFFGIWKLPPSYTSAPDTTIPQGSISINSGVSYTNSASVTLSLSATDSVGVNAYYLSTSSTTPSASDSGWIALTSTVSYSASASHILSSGDGSKTIYAWYKDAAGNVSSVSQASITLDATSPTIIISSPTTSSTYSTSSNTLSLSGTASDEASGSGLKEVTWSSSQGGSGTATLTDS